MTILAAILFTALVMGYPLHRAHVKLAAVESELEAANALLRSIFKAAYKSKPTRHVRRCVNPQHLEPVTPRENIRRGEPANRTQCPRGHAYTPENTRVRGGKRHCLACHRINQANYLARKAS